MVGPGGLVPARSVRDRVRIRPALVRADPIGIGWNSKVDRVGWDSIGDPVDGLKLQLQRTRVRKTWRSKIRGSVTRMAMVIVMWDLVADCRSASELTLDDPLNSSA